MKVRMFMVYFLKNGMNRSRIIILFLLAAPLTFSQVPREKNYEMKEESGSLKHGTLIDSAVFYKKKDIAKSIAFIAGSLQVLDGSHTEKEALSYSTLGDIYMFWKQYDLAVSNYKNAVWIDSRPETVLKLAQAYFLHKNYTESYATYKTLTGNRTLSPYQEILLYEGLGDVHDKQHQFKEANKNYETALRISRQNLVTPKITDLNSKLADVYSRSGNTAKAEAYYGNSLDLANRQNAGRAVIEKEKVADFYKKENSYDKEIELRRSALEEVEAMEDQAMETEAEPPGKASITSQSINYKIANAYIAKNQPREAISYLQKSIAEAGEEDDLVVQKDATRTLSEVYKTVGDYGKALESYQKYVELVDALYLKKEEEIGQVVQFSKDIALQQSRITSLEQERQLSESRYQLAVKDQELIRENNKRQRLLIYFLVFGLLMTGVTAYFFYRSSRQQKLANHVLALRSLRSQMNPHFIFNALNSVNNFIARNDERSANRFLSEFSALMRSVLDHSEEDFIPLSKEIELLELYVKLEHSRFPEKFDYHIHIDKDIAVEAFQIPPMLLQPYVENAIWHGLRYKEEKGRLNILFSQINNETLQITIEDDGIGRVRSGELKTRHQRQQHSRGMSNIEKRIAILNRMYKDKIAVQIEDMFEDGSGTRVVLTLKQLANSEFRI